MPRRKNWKDGLQQAIIETGKEETAIAVQVEGATFEVPGGLNVHLEHDGTEPDSVQIGDGTNLLSVNPDGSINTETSSTPAGLSTAGKITEVTLNASTWTALPPTALTDRNGLGIQNANGVEIKLNFDNLEPGYVGWRVAANGETFIDIQDNVVIYAKAASGTPVVTIMEVS